jgi:16S rRNA (uracil1498-N3)-methyltransferase
MGAAGPPRFLVPAPLVAGGLVTLPPEETHHLRHVLRLARGAEVAVFDGKGIEYLGQVERVARDGVQVRLVAMRTATPEPRVHLCLAQAVLKGDAMDSVIRDATMMGVAAIQPLVSARTQVRPTAAGQGRLADRWRRISIASAKQCRRAVVPDIRPPCALPEYLAGETAAARLVLVEPEAAGQTGRADLRTIAPPPAGAVLVGPEGGWTPEELADAQAAGFIPVTLGRRTLRADVAPIAMLAVLEFLWGDL